MFRKLLKIDIPYLDSNIMDHIKDLLSEFKYTPSKDCFTFDIYNISLIDIEITRGCSECIATVEYDADVFYAKGKHKGIITKVYNDKALVKVKNFVEVITLNEGKKKTDEKVNVEVYKSRIVDDKLICLGCIVDKDE